MVNVNLINKIKEPNIEQIQNILYCANHSLKQLNMIHETESFYDKNNIIFGFHRLAINGLDNISNQPIESNNNYLICNGEIYNHNRLQN